MELRQVVAARHLGPITIVGLLVAYVALWVVARPQGEPTTAYVGQLVGAVSILLLSAALVLISSLSWVEEWFDVIALRPLGKPVTFVPGQFALVYIEAKDGWHRHPFTITSSPGEGVVRVAVKALGDYTSSLRDLLEPGMPAVIGGPHGRFNHAKGNQGADLDRRRCRRRPLPQLDASPGGPSTPG